MNYCSIVCSDVWWIQNFSELYLHIFTSILRLHMNLLIQINKCDIVWQSKILLKFQGVALRCYVKLLVRLIQVSVSWILQFWWSNRHDSHQKTSSKKAMLATFTELISFDPWFDHLCWSLTDKSQSFRGLANSGLGAWSARVQLRLRLSRGPLGRQGP